MRPNIKTLIYHFIFITSITIAIILSTKIFTRTINVSLSLSNEVWAAILGATLGTLGAYLIGVAVEKRNQKRIAEEKLENKLREYFRTITETEVQLQEKLVILYKNAWLLEGIPLTIKDGFYTITMPRIVTFENANPLGFRNDELLAEWSTLKIRANMTSQLLEDFNEQYKDMSRLVLHMLIKGEKPDAKLVTEERITSSKMSESVLASVNNTIETAERLLAMVRVHGRINKVLTTRFSDVEFLVSYRVSKKDIASEMKDIKKQFNKDMFQTV